MISFKYKLIILFFIAAPVVIFLFAFAFAAHAQNPFDIEFPIAELGNCNSIDECRAYCENADNKDACIAWGNEQGIDVGERGDIEIEEGPGGCTSEEECFSYCNDPVNADECLEYGVEHGHISAEEAERIRSQREEGGPGGCQGHEECQDFCSEPENQTECIDFAVAKGFMPVEQAAQIKAFLSGELPGIPQGGEFGPSTRDFGPDVEPNINIQKVQQLLAEQDGPGGCEGFEECEEYCSDPENSDECFAFATEHELFPPEEAERLQKLMNTEGPGGCRGRECEAYCEEPGHERECLSFAREQGLMSEEEFEEINRFVTVIEERGGPGGCKGRQCETFCNDPAHRDACFDFAKSNNLLPPGELERIEKFKNIEKKVEEQGGPGGCRGEGECRTYCMDTSHFDECAAFAVNEGFLSPDEAKSSLRQFIEIEHFGPPSGHGGFGPQGFGPSGPRDFPGGPGGFPGGPQGFSPGGFPGGPGGFSGGPGGLPPEFEEQFKSRFQQFQQLRGEFEQGRIPQPGDFIQGEGFREGFQSQGFSDEMRAQFEREGHQAPFPGQFPDQGEFGDEFEGEFEPGDFQGFPPGGFQGRGEFEGEGEDNGEFHGFPPPGFGFPGREGSEEFDMEFEDGGFEGGFPPSGQFPRQIPGEGGFPPSSRIPPSGSFTPPTTGSFTPPPTDSSYHPPEGSFIPQPPTGSYTPPPTGTFEGSGSFVPPPPTNSFSPPPTGSFTPPPPTSFLNGVTNLFANILSIFPLLR